MQAGAEGFDDAEVRDAGARIEEELGGYPVFIKPANMGSSVGIHKVEAAAGMQAVARSAREAASARGAWLRARTGRSDCTRA